jgi:ubiquinone/menaquinone biosynthesis C-methylase UbiE
MQSISERIFLFLENLCTKFYKRTGLVHDDLSRFTSFNAYAEWEWKNAKRDFEFFQDKIQITGKKMLDIGCGKGGKSVYYTKMGAELIGCDIEYNSIQTASKFAKLKKVSDKASFVVCDASALPFKSEKFDIVISNNVIEHLKKCVESINEMKRVVKNNGKICINFGPPWFSPFGAHISNKLPWAHLVFSQTTIRNVFMKDGRKNIDFNKDLYDSVNRITIRKFKRMVAESGLQIVFFKLTTRPYFRFLVRIPFVNEFFVGQVVAMLKKPHPSQNSRTNNK